MCLARLLLFLGVEKITQTSFAEYHSKRYSVERVHAEESRVLLAHSPFQSSPIHPNTKTGSKEHLENMNQVCENVKDCLKTATFGGKPVTVESK